MGTAKEIQKEISGRQGRLSLIVCRPYPTIIGVYLDIFKFSDYWTQD